MYQERKAIEVAAFFLRKKEGLAMAYYDLIKLMYLAEREQMRRKGRTITGDELYSLPWGPILSSALDSVRLNKGDEWSDFIQTDATLKRSTLVKDAPPAKISKGELKVLESVWDEFGHMDGPELMRYTHGLPEYTDTESRVLISLDKLARAVGHDETAVDMIESAELERNHIRRFKDHLAETAKIA